MLTSYILLVTFVIISIVFRFAIRKYPVRKIPASWVSFTFGVISTTICTLLYKAPQSTLVSGFLTMLLTYAILTAKIKRHRKIQ